MKKLGLVVSMLLCALVMVSCANATGGKGADSKAEVSVSGVPDGKYELTGVTIDGKEVNAGPDDGSKVVIDVKDNSAVIQGAESTLNADGTITAPADAPFKDATWSYKDNVITMKFTLLDPADAKAVQTWTKVK